MAGPSKPSHRAQGAEHVLWDSLPPEAILANDFCPPGEEPINTLTHGVATVVAILGLAVLIPDALARKDPLHTVGCVVFGLATIFVYLSSTLYHGTTEVRRKALFRTMDQVCIYLMIAGTYTPFLLTTLRGVWGWSLLAAVWILAVAGILFRIFWVHRSAHFSAIPYIVLGWLAIVAVDPMVHRIPPSGLLLILAGGLSYTVGVYFYIRDQKPYFHAIWHLFTVVGTTCHFWAVLYYASAPPPAG